MANPTSRHCSSRRDKRRANWKGILPNAIKCPQCGEMKLSHRVCLSCGSYNGRDVINVLEKE
ncbi:Ribosomal protein L32p [Candidatus Magnetoovum chiemensis]|nr:Ribosomal protein L32p [Candidatus Magnetoovum chiemensis]